MAFLQLCLFTVFLNSFMAKILKKDDFRRVELLNLVTKKWQASKI